MTDQELTTFRDRLTSRAAVLRGELLAVDAERDAASGATSQTDVDDSAAAGEQHSRDAVRNAEQDRDADELHDIAAALARLDDGSYGGCIDCGVAIALPRLHAQPAAARCIGCQTAYEKDHPVQLRAARMH